MKLKNENNSNTNLRNFFRLIIVFLAWLVSSLVPTSTTGFYQSIFIASITALYEYVIIYVDHQNERSRTILSFIGIILSIAYLIFSFLGFSNLVILDLESLKFILSDTLPIPNANAVKWSYYYTVYPMVIFPGLVVIEFFLKPNNQSIKIKRNDKEQKGVV